MPILHNGKLRRCRSLMKFQKLKKEEVGGEKQKCLPIDLLTLILTQSFSSVCTVQWLSKEKGRLLPQHDQLNETSDNCYLFCRRGNVMQKKIKSTHSIFKKKLKYCFSNIAI